MHVGVCTCPVPRTSWFALKQAGSELDALGGVLQLTWQQLTCQQLTWTWKRWCSYMEQYARPRTASAYSGAWVLGGVGGAMRSARAHFGAWQAWQRGRHGNVGSGLHASSEARDEVGYTVECWLGAPRSRMRAGTPQAGRGSGCPGNRAGALHLCTCASVHYAVAVEAAAARGNAQQGAWDATCAPASWLATYYGTLGAGVRSRTNCCVEVWSKLHGAKKSGDGGHLEVGGNLGEQRSFAGFAD